MRSARHKVFPKKRGEISVGLHAKPRVCIREKGPGKWVGVNFGLMIVKLRGDVRASAAAPALRRGGDLRRGGSTFGRSPRGPVGGFRVVRGDVEPDIDQVVLGPSCTANDRQCGPVTLCRAQRSRACCSSVKRRPASALTPGAAGKTLGPEPP